jgi:hypothetical protein
MNEVLQARDNLKSGLSQLPDDWQRKFKLMYARNGGRRSVEDSVAMDINDVVDHMPEENLSWAMEQVQRSVDKLAAKDR